MSWPIGTICAIVTYPLIMILPVLTEECLELCGLFLLSLLGQVPHDESRSILESLANLITTLRLVEPRHCAIETEGLAHEI